MLSCEKQENQPKINLAKKGFNRRRISITTTGIVQGIGFRPYLFTLAKKLDLAGWVQNRVGSVQIEIEGSAHAIEQFLSELRLNTPPLIRVESVAWKEMEPQYIDHFEIKESKEEDRSEALIPSDLATCNLCLRELFDPNNRRFQYPLLNCAHCGPRMTIIERLPYDRKNTSMKNFQLCIFCKKEYDDPTDRRFHAQPTACPVCGPQLCLFNQKGIPVPTSDPIQMIAKMLLQGRIIAMKGLGGYHLVCDARNTQTVTRLRQVKRRNDKPFAIMVKDLSVAREICAVSEAEEQILLSVQRPIVLLEPYDRNQVSFEVSRGMPKLGIMLPYTPMHYLLFDLIQGVPLVMTSGNDSNHPILFKDEDALIQFAPIADLILYHNRPIQAGCDDSVVWVQKSKSPQLRVIRRSRGYAPGSLELPYPAAMPILALGAQKKCTFALAQQRYAILSQHIGNLDEFTTLEWYQSEIIRYQDLFQIKPQLLVHDYHPNYLSTSYAVERAKREHLILMPVQHHHAHMASCMAEHGITQPVIGVVFDGTGFGTDGKIWGGEFLFGDYRTFQRMAHLKYVPMPSGEQAIREPWRMAVAHLMAANQNLNILKFEQIFKPNLEINVIKVLIHMIDREINCPRTSSMGRLFDAVASIMGLRQRVNFEGQAAVLLESLAQSGKYHDYQEPPYSFDFQRENLNFPIVIDPSSVISSLISDLLGGIPDFIIARKFHSSVSQMICEICSLIRTETQNNRVILSGGVFMNALLLSEATERLQCAGFEVFNHQTIPCNDGGISLGQLAIAAAK